MISKSQQRKPLNPSDGPMISLEPEFPRKVSRLCETQLFSIFSLNFQNWQPWCFRNVSNAWHVSWGRSDSSVSALACPLWVQHQEYEIDLWSVMHAICDSWAVFNLWYLTSEFPGADCKVPMHVAAGYIYAHWSVKKNEEFLLIEYDGFQRVFKCLCTSTPGHTSL